MALAKAFAQQLAAFQKLFGGTQHNFMLPFGLRIFILEVWASACGGSGLSWLLKTYWNRMQALEVYRNHAVKTSGGGSPALGCEDQILFFVILLTCLVTKFIFPSGMCSVNSAWQSASRCAHWRCGLSCVALGHAAIWGASMPWCWCLGDAHVLDHTAQSTDNAEHRTPLYACIHPYMSWWWHLLHPSESNFLICGLLCGVTGAECPVPA